MRLRMVELARLWLVFNIHDDCCVVVVLDEEVVRPRAIHSFKTDRRKVRR